ncbi:MAG TPA: helix-turn-helix transcriptional regulator [Candidatus Polarisedimenticolaceae bacterium]
MEPPVALPVAAEPKPPRLSPREAEVISLFAAGHSYKSAADTLGVRIDTVRFHVRAAYAKLRAHSKAEAVAAAARFGQLR